MQVDEIAGQHTGQEQVQMQQKINAQSMNVKATQRRDKPTIQLFSSKLSDYKKISELGRGTYGEVYKCIHNPTGQVVAMKSYLFEVSQTYI